MDIMLKNQHQITYIYFMITTALSVHFVKAALDNTTNSKYCPQNGEHDDPSNCSLETKLVNRILERYRIHSTASRPLKDSSKNVTVWYGMRLVYMNIDEKTQTLTTSVWVRMRWYDEIAGWNRTEFDVHSVYVSEGQIWTPSDITVVNTIETKTEERKADIKVRHDGRVLWFPQRKYKSECLLNMKDYPYDVHTCVIWVQSLTYSSSMLNLQPYYFNGNTPLDLDTYLVSQRMSQEWEIIDNSTTKEAVPRNSAILMYSRRPALKFTLTLRRRPGFISYLLRFPVVLLSFMCSLIFCLPTERPDRNMLAMSLFASFMILLLILVDNVPPSAAAIPKLVYLYCSQLCTLIVCIACSISVIHLSRRGDTGVPPPYFIQRIVFDCLAKLLCVHHGRLTEIGYPEVRNITENKSESLDWETDQSADDRTQLACLHCTKVSSCIKRSNGIYGSNSKAIADKQWKLLAFVMDRLFCLFFFVINVVVVVLLFPMP